MPTASERIAHREPWRLPAWLGLCLFLAIAGFFLWEEHRAHLLGALPYVLLLFRLPPAVATLVTLVMFPMLVTVYVRLARREEREVRAKFGAVWAYAADRPPFIPRLRSATRPIGRHRNGQA